MRTVHPAPLLCCLLISPLAAADAVPLSTLVGVPSGQAAVFPNPPFVTLLDVPFYGIGADCPGNWTPLAIQFIDTPALAHGLGQHPPSSGQSRIDFSIPAIETLVGRRVEGFTARIGIESRTSSAENGATFSVLLDGVSVMTRTIGGRSFPSVPVSIPTLGAHTLTLMTSRVGDFNSNHACWGLAEVTLGAPICPVDFNRDGFLDFFDFDDYVTCFEGIACPAGRNADFNTDGFVDFFDYDDFIASFEAGC